MNINNNEGDVYLKSGLIHDLARELGGALVTADDRFLDRNVVPWVSLFLRAFQKTMFAINYYCLLSDATVAEYKFFTVDQMVADVAFLIQKFRLDHPTGNSKVVTFGGQGGGTIAVFARKRFPHLIDAAWSSGGLYQFNASNPGKICGGYFCFNSPLNARSLFLQHFWLVPHEQSHDTVNGPALRSWPPPWQNSNNWSRHAIKSVW